ncbi:hypothetical protein AB0F11_04120 [Streptomyces sp. NPDC032472]|uniref:hypothetical protein n=1 Tax=Streptomyces sp. NPDC032472 TaxID=3155018 RepID=UPI0034079FF3
MDVAALVQAGATTLVGLMTTQAWTSVSGRFGRLFGRPEAEAELGASRAELLVARADGNEAAAADVEQTWRDRLREVLETDQAAVRELAALLDEVNPGWRGTEGGRAPKVSNLISGGTFNGGVFQGGDFGNITLNQSPHRAQELDAPHEPGTQHP